MLVTITIKLRSNLGSMAANGGFQTCACPSSSSSNPARIMLLLFLLLLLLILFSSFWWHARLLELAIIGYRLRCQARPNQATRESHTLISSGRKILWARLRGTFRCLYDTLIVYHVCVRCSVSDGWCSVGAVERAGGWQSRASDVFEGKGSLYLYLYLQRNGCSRTCAFDGSGKQRQQ